MIILISPAKTLDFETLSCTKKATTPDFLADSTELIHQLRDLSPADVSGLMSISDKLGLLNFDRFQAWNTPFTADNAKQAALAFKGDVYTGLNAETFSAKDFTFAQKHLRILSGLYGLLRPLDYIQPYRLEMGTRFSNKRGTNLYQFWGDDVTNAINTALKKQKGDTIINLASNEYFKVVNKKILAADIITPAFKDWKNGQYKMISFFAKKARGLMSAYIIKHQITNPEDIKKFDSEDYKFDKKLSSERDWVFTRKQ